MSIKKKTQEEIDQDIANIYSGCVEVDKDLSLSKKEIKTLKEVLGIVACKEEQYSGLNKLCGGYCNITVDDIDISGDYDEENDEEIDLIEFWIEAGVCDESGKSSNSSRLRISRKVINDESLTVGEKAKKVEEA